MEEQEPKPDLESFYSPVGMLTTGDDATDVKICSVSAEEDDNYNGTTNDSNNKAVVESKNDIKIPEEEPRMFLLSNNGTLCLEFVEDQGREDNFTDLDLICCDGYIQVHRCLLMGASKFLRDLLIGKDMMDTTAITLPDITVRHLRQALGLLYTGKTLIDARDELQVFETMNTLGLPVSGLLCRTAKDNDMNQIAVLRHNLSDDGICLEEMSEDEAAEKSTDEVKSEESAMVKVTNEEQQHTTITTKVLDTDDEGVSENTELAKEPMPTNDEDLLQQITSTTGDSDSPNYFVSASQEGKFLLDEVAKVNNSQVYKLLQPNSDTQTEPDHGSVILKSDDDSEKALPFAKVADEEEIVENQDSPSNNSLHSVISDREDLSFEAACNDLQKQVAKPIASMETTPTATGHEMKLRKRKTNEPPDQLKLAADGTRSVGIKKKKTTPKKGKDKNATKNGTKSDNEDELDMNKPTDDNLTAENPKDKFPSPVYASKTDKSDSTSQQRRLSTCSSTTDSNGATSNLSRVFLEMKEFNGIKYNIYGLMDSEKGIQSGKTIAIMTSKDKSTNVKI